MARRPSAIPTTVVTSDTTIKSSGGKVWWITISNAHATDSTQVELADDATDRWGVNVEAVDILGKPVHIEFDPPIQFDTSILIDISNGTVKATVAFT